MKKIKRITVICFAVLVLAANLPLCASATDPVSAATMANAMAQAITAYGASQGVSMTFDVADPNGIGEGVHELWDQFKEEVNDPNTPTYDSLAVTMWSNLYSKIGNNLGINISASEMPYIDAFWDWLLSGPAEMSKVDNEYYEWTVNQNNTVDPIVVIQDNLFGNVKLYTYLEAISSVNSRYSYKFTATDCYLCFIRTDNNTGYTIAAINFSDVHNVGSYEFSRVNNDYINTYNLVWTYNYNASVGGPAINDSNNYTLSQSPSGLTLTQFSQMLQGGTESYSTSDISVRPYVGDAVPQNVYIPDNTDVNYNPTDVAIPLDIPWDNTLFGDGDGVLTDAQSTAATTAADDAITDSLEKTLTLADTENPDIPVPNEVYIPLLPVELPSFNFSLSGIWHYVVSWVQSLGAWLSLMFQTWAVLPSAITIPVYATAVIVIVLGVYKRFFM